MTSEELKYEPPIILHGRRVGLGPLRRELVPAYVRWQTDFEVLRGMGTSGQVPHPTRRARARRRLIGR